MKVVASNIFEFTSWYKFGYKFIPSEIIIDLADVKISGDELLHKTGFFEEEYEVFYLEISEMLFLATNQSQFISFHDVLSLIPLTEKGGKLLSTKIPDFKISNAISFEIASKLIEARNRHLAINGGKRLIESFGLTSCDLIEKYQDAFMLSLNKYFKDLNSEQDSMLDNLIFYERSKPYPLTDIGFLFDVGGIAKTRFNLTDADFKNKSLLKVNESHKYEIIEEVLALSAFLQGKHTERSWSKFINEYSLSDLLKKLSSDLSMVDSNEEINHILVVAFYLKFRYLIRNTSSLEDIQFTETIKTFLNKVQTETTIALYLVGMFFGASKFKTLFYKYVPLKISRLKYYAHSQSSTEELESAKESKKAAIENLGVLEVDTNKKQHEKYHVTMHEIILPVNYSDDLAFDEQLCREIEKGISKFTTKQQKIIMDCYSIAAIANGDLFPDRSDYMVNLLKKKMNKSTAKDPNSKLTNDIIKVVQSILTEMTISIQQKD